jgi:1,4-alpha-glucan branching enzyme
VLARKFSHFCQRKSRGNTFDIEKLKQVLDAKQQGYQQTTNVINYLATPPPLLAGGSKLSD